MQERKKKDGGKNTIDGLFSKDKVSICFVLQSKVRQRVIDMKEGYR
jgi:hypothetical protein